MGNPSHKTHPASVPGQAGTLRSPASLDSCCPHVTALTRKAVLFYNMFFGRPSRVLWRSGDSNPFQSYGAAVAISTLPSNGLPPVYWCLGHQYHVQICPSCNRACTIKIGWCTMSDMENSDTTPFHVEVWGVEPLSVAKASSVASPLCCRCLPSLSPRQPVEGLVFTKMILVSPTRILTLTGDRQGATAVARFVNHRMITIVPVWGFEPHQLK